MQSRGQNDAKDTFWELEIWHQARRSRLAAELNEPDVTWNDGQRLTGIACKKIYSEAHIQNVLSEAVHQIEKYVGYGFAAFSVDELTPGDKLLSVATREEATNKLQDINLQFLSRHARHFRRYFSTDRLTGAIVSVSCITALTGKDGTPYVQTEQTVWTSPEVSTEHRHRIERFKAALSGA
jgi:hypothetical protein